MILWLTKHSSGRKKGAVEFYDFYEQKNSEKLKKLGSFLVNNGCSKDKFILMALGTEKYSTNEVPNAIKYLKRAIEGGYCSEMARPSSESMIHFENAQIFYMLSVIYTEQGDTKKANENYTKSQELFKKIKQEPPSQDLIKKWEDMSKMTLNHFKKDIQ